MDFYSLCSNNNLERGESTSKVILRFPQEDHHPALVNARDSDKIKKRLLLKVIGGEKTMNRMVAILAILYPTIVFLAFKWIFNKNRKYDRSYLAKLCRARLDRILNLAFAVVILLTLAMFLMLN